MRYFKEFKSPRFKRSTLIHFKWGSVPAKFLEDLWLSAFPVGTEWENIDKIKEFNWSFENLEVWRLKLIF
uniref:Uncharacterized protein n=1 Tax=Zea mays TaxID=4577 RepID=A0A804N0S8_MAIZE